MVLKAQTPGISERSGDRLTEKTFKGRVSFRKGGGVQAVNKDFRYGSEKVV